MTKKKFKYGDYVHLSPTARIRNSLTGELLPHDVVRRWQCLWNVDHYEEETGMLNVSRALVPYPGAYCSWVHERYVIDHETSN